MARVKASYLRAIPNWSFLVKLAGAKCLLAGVAFSAAAALAQTPPGVGAPPNTRLQPLPNAPYVPLTNRQKLQIFLRQTYAPYTFLTAGYNALYAQATGDPYEYGGGMEGYGKRFGASVANTEASRFFVRFLLPSIFRQDPRYFPAQPGTRTVGRAWHAATRVFVTRGDSGCSEFNYSQVIGTAFTVSLENAYSPERERGFGDTMSRLYGALLSDATGNITREFWPDIKRIFRRHEPRSIQDIQQKIERRIPPSMKGDQ